MDFNDMLNDVLDGFIIIAKIILCLAMIASIVIGVFSAILVAIGKLPFSWWFVPCWIVDLIAVAGAVGSASNNW